MLIQGSVGLHMDVSLEVPVSDSFSQPIARRGGPGARATCIRSGNAHNLSSSGGSSTRVGNRRRRVQATALIHMAATAPTRLPRSKG